MFLLSWLFYGILTLFLYVLCNLVLKTIGLMSIWASCYFSPSLDVQDFTTFTYTNKHFEFWQIECLLIMVLRNRLKLMKRFLKCMYIIWVLMLFWIAYVLIFFFNLFVEALVIWKKFCIMLGLLFFRKLLK